MLLVNPNVNSPGRILPPLPCTDYRTESYNTMGRKIVTKPTELESADQWYRCKERLFKDWDITPTMRGNRSAADDIKTLSLLRRRHSVFSHRPRRKSSNVSVKHGNKVTPGIPE
jgi:hypothetical protein